MLVIIPVKNLEQAKQRLAPVLTSEERRQLVKAMLEDVLAAVCGHPRVEGVLLVSDDPFARSLSKRRGIGCVSETALRATGLNAVLQQAVRHVKSRGVREVLVLHGDLPYISAADVTDLWNTYRTLHAPAMVIAPDRHRTGTNGLLINVDHKPQFGFGKDSFAWHCEQAKQLGVTLCVCDSAGTRRDIDLPEDLKYLAMNSNYQGALRSREYLRGSGLRDRMLKSSNKIRQEISRLTYSNYPHALGDCETEVAMV